MPDSRQGEAAAAESDETLRRAPLPAGFDLQGHRGARGLLPENTVPGFLKALALGVTTLEMDAVITGDGEVVLSHEPWFSSTICSLPTGEPVPPDRARDYRIYAMSYAEIARFDCGRRGHPGFPRQTPMPAVKPLLRDVIAAGEAYVRRHRRAPVFYNVETKSAPEGDGILHPDPETFTRLLYDVLVETGVKDRATLQSFDVRTLQAGRRLDRTWTLSLLVEAGGDRSLADELAALGFTPDIYSPDFRLVDEALVRDAHGRGMRVIPWTVNTLDDMRRLAGLGVDGLITDYPDLGIDLLTTFSNE